MLGYIIVISHFSLFKRSFTKHGNHKIWNSKNLHYTFSFSIFTVADCLIELIYEIEKMAQQSHLGVAESLYLRAFSGLNSLVS